MTTSVSEEQIQAEIDRRFAADTEAAPATPAPVASAAAAPAAAAPAAAAPAAAAPAAVASDAGDSDAEAYVKLRAAEEKLRAAADKNKSSIPGMEAYNSLPEGAKPYVLGAAGIVGGKILRGALPQEKVYDTPGYKTKQQDYKNLVSVDQPRASQAVQNAQDLVRNAQEQHQASQRALQTQHQTAYQTHADNLAELDRAQRQHAYAQTLTAEDELARRQPPRTGALSAPAPAPGLTLLPRGGEGTANYSEKFGATPQEARVVSSMSAMQQQNIPAQQQAWSKIPSIAPGFEPVKESPLLLGTEGQQATREKMAAQAAEDQRKAALAAQADAELKRMQAEIARQKADAQLRLENAQKNMGSSLKATLAANKAIDTHSATPPVSPTQQTNLSATQADLKALQDRISSGAPGLLTKLGKFILPRSIPGAGAAFAPVSAAKAREEWIAGNPWRAAAYGVGSLGSLAQATGIPPLMGIGNIAQLAPLAAIAYDYSNEQKDKP